MTVVVDGSISAALAGVSTGTISLVTALQNDIILVGFAIADVSGQTVSNITDTLGGHLAWTKRTAVATPNVDLEMWYATWTGSGTIGIIPTFSASATVAVVAVGLNGVLLSSPFDANGALPATNTGPSGNTLSATITTSNPKDMLVNFASQNWGTATLTVGGAWTKVIQANAGAGSIGTALIFQYDNVTAAGTAQVLATDNARSAPWAMIGDALVAFSQPAEGAMSGSVLAIASGNATGNGTHRNIAPPHLKISQADRPTVGQQDSVSMVVSGKPKGEATFHDSVVLHPLHQTLSLTEHMSAPLVAGKSAFPGGKQQSEVTLYVYAPGSQYIGIGQQEVGGQVTRQVESSPGVFNFQYPGYE